MKQYSFTKYLSFLSFLLLVLFFYSSCKKKNNLNSFYFSGNDSIQLIIPGDTIGILYRDPAPDTSLSFNAAFNKMKSFADSSLMLQGYNSAGFMTENVEYLTSSKKHKSILSLEKEARNLKDSNKSFIAHSGYLARIKESNEPVIITNEINIAFKQGTTDNQITDLFREYKLTVVQKNPFVPLQYTVSVSVKSKHTALNLSHKLKKNPKIRFAYINIIYRKEFDSVIPDDEFFEKQWHLVNTGTNSAAMQDADIDAEKAWDYTMGSDNIIIAVIDGGFEVDHEDLKENFSKNNFEIPWNNIDDDDFDANPNTFVDDTIGWNFLGDAERPFGSNMLRGGRHGTAVTGVAAAKSNEIGLAGSCPGCRILPLRTLSGSVESMDALAINYAVEYRGAKVINLSWHTRTPVPLIIEQIDNATAKGVIVICSMINDDINSCNSFPISYNQNTIAISRSNRFDQFDNSGMGDCLDLLAPSCKQRESDDEIYGITTTDEMGNSGYSDGAIDFGYAAAINNANYTSTFWGTSASVPLTAGVVGLILSVDPTLTQKQVQNLLQDCADKIQPASANYSKQDGKSRNGMHGFGRLNAYEAVKIAAPVNNGSNKSGQGGIDVFFRDNELDWGNTEQSSSTRFESPRTGIGWWASQDIKVDAPPFTSAGGVEIVIDNNKKFEDLVDEDPKGGEMNRVYVRVRNRGYKTIPSVTVKLHWTDACLGFPALPFDFWNNFPSDASDVSVWHPFLPKTITGLRYSGSSVANSGDDDGSQIVKFEFDTPVHDETKPRNHYCLMALAFAPGDPMPTNELTSDPQKLNMDYVTTHFNNATHRNYSIKNTDQPFNDQFILYNPYPYPITTRIETDPGKKKIIVFDDSLMTKDILLQKGEKRIVSIKINPGELLKPEIITIEQILISNKNNKKIIMGGYTYLLNKPNNKSGK